MVSYNDMNTWFAHITKTEENSIIIEVTSSVNALVGEYSKLQFSIQKFQIKSSSLLVSLNSTKRRH